MISSLVKFVNGSAYLHPDDNLQLLFNSNEAKVLLEADSCFNKIVLPIGNTSYEEMKKACMTSLDFGGVGYGKF